ncbi:hypothetical protein, conserved [Eimeria brunetti]|uniref:Transmembrane protein n=1 Tax=Eimeria brunetti TaxID=51314 RepID=U6LUX5_9EIME|nr:hypothetical protein, conserved [Eimeria brunetti]
MERVKLLDEMGTTDVSTAANTAAVHLNVFNQRTKPGSTSQELKLHLGVAACLVLLFLMGVCSRFIRSRRLEHVDRRRLASGGGAPGKDESEAEGDKQCFVGSSEPTEDDETSFLESVGAFHQPVTQPQASGLAEKQPRIPEKQEPPGTAAPSLGPSSRAHGATPPAGESTVGAIKEPLPRPHASTFPAEFPRSAEEKTPPGAAAASPEHSSHPHGAALSVGEPRVKYRDQVRKRREALGRAFQHIDALLQAGMRELNNSWEASNPHWPYCQALFGALKHFAGQASALFNAENRRFGVHERLEWLNKNHAGWISCELAWNVLSAFASEHYLVAPDRQTPPAEVDARVSLLVEMNEVSFELEESMAEHAEKRAAETLARLNAAIREASNVARGASVYLSSGTSPSEDLLFESVKEKLLKLRGRKLEAMRMLSQGQGH